MIYRVTAKQTYYVDAESPEQAQMFFISDDEHVGIGFTEVVNVELQQESEAQESCDMDLLIVVDMQKDFIDGVLGTPEAQAIVPNVIDVVNKWRGDIVCTKDWHRPDRYLNTIEGKMIPFHCYEYMPGSEILPEIQEKITHITLKDVFAPYRLWRKQYEKYDSYTVIGLVTDICVISTALMLRSLYPDKRVFVDASCCAGTTPEMHRKALDVMRSCCINVVGE